MQQAPTKNKPIHDIRLGLIRAAIWKNEHENGVRYSVSITKIYKDKEGDEWKSTDYFGRDELLLVAKVADQTHTWIYEQAQERAQDREGGNGGRFRGANK